jgi:hypothetical protein
MKVLFICRQYATRTMILLGAAALVIAVIYIPVRWGGVSQAAARREGVRREALRNMPLEFRERLRERERIQPAPARLRMLTTQFVVIAIAAWIGRRILRLRLKR